MTEAPIINKAPTLSEQYLLKEKDEKADAGTKPVEVKEVDGTPNAAPLEVVNEKSEVVPASEGNTVVSPAAEVNTVVTSVAAAGETAGSKAEESSETAQEENLGDQEDAEQQPEIKIETAPADFRFPTTNQSRHCFTRYVEYHRCVAAKGEDASECNKFAKYYRALCPGEWVDRWNEQRENGTFPGPL